VRLTVNTHCLACILMVRCAADDVTARHPTSLCATEDHYSRGLKRGGEWVWLFLNKNSWRCPWTDVTRTNRQDCSQFDSPCIMNLLRCWSPPITQWYWRGKGCSSKWSPWSLETRKACQIYFLWQTYTTASNTERNTSACVMPQQKLNNFWAYHADVTFTNLLWMC